MRKKISITGGAGFIGSHVAEELLDNGYEARALDSLSKQVHGPEHQRPSYFLPRESEQLSLIRNEHLKRPQEPRSKRLAGANGNYTTHHDAVRHG